MSLTLELFRKRRSIRKYEDKPVEQEKILACLEAARLAPSASNVEPWKFIVVDGKDLKNKLADEAFSGLGIINSFAKEAPVLIVVVAERDLIVNRIVSAIRDLQFYLLDIGAAVENLLLQAAELGLGTCWLGIYNENKVKKLLKIPMRKKVVSIISLGYPAEEPKQKKRKSLDEMSSFNKYH
ncbi:MAG: nitroreductase family protein [Candidatus Saganbacteria bacterium]|nr:nitroreductase family protein [Candidatus Saganbacteria bacterium]